MTGQPPEGPDSQDDLESTAELPTLDATAFEPTPPWMVARARAAANARRPEQRTAQLEAPGKLEQALAEARGARVTAERRAEDLARELIQTREALAAARAELSGHESQLARLQEDVGERGKRASELQAWVTERDTRIAELEEHTRTLVATLTERDAQLRETTELQQRLAALEDAARDHSTVLAEREAQIEQLLASEQALQEQLVAVQTRLAEATQRCEALQSEALAHRQQIEALQDKAARLRMETVSPGSSPPPGAGSESEALAAAQAQLKELIAALAEEQETVRSLRADVVASTVRERELEADLKAAAEALSRREAGQSGSNGRLAELEKVAAGLRAEVEDARAALAERDAAIEKLQEENAASVAVLQAMQQGTEESGPPFGATRLLIRTDGDTETAHVLGRRTSIGRSSDNDVQVDATSISRHHALILAGPASTVIEDLRSTNGVRINGHRITRQVLRDGDSIMIGKAQFRFVMRDAPEEED